MLTGGMVIVTGAVVARAETFERLLEASLAHVERSRTEPGCIEHGVAIDAEDPMRLKFFEIWTDAGALSAHFAQPGSAEFMAAVSEYAAESGKISVYAADKVRV
jgi:quinol monooxygenase YgiN